MTDEKLFNAIKAYKSGDKKQATVIYESTKKYTYRIVYQDVTRFKNQSVLTGDINAITEDVMQELYLNFFNNIDKFRNEEPESIYKWISVVSHRKVLEFVDKNKMEILQFEKDEEFREENSVWDSTEINDSDMECNREMLPEAALEDKEFQQLIFDFIQSLPETQAQTILLHFRGGMKYQEIADEMGVSLITVKTRMKKAKDSLGLIINEYEKKTGTKLHTVSVLPMLWFLYRLAAEKSKVPAAVNLAVKSSLGVSGFAKAVGTKILIGVVSTVVIIGGIVVGNQIVGQEQEPIIEEEQVEEPKTEQQHHLIWKGETIDITEYVHKSEFNQAPDGTFGGAYIASDEVLVKMGFEKSVDDSGNPAYKYGDLNIVYYMDTDTFGLGSQNQIDTYSYGITFFKEDETYYVDARLALRLLVIDGYVNTGEFGKYLIGDMSESNHVTSGKTQVIAETERIKKYTKKEANVQLGMGDDDDILGTLKEHDGVMVVGEQDSWSKVLYKGYVGYVKSENLTLDIVEEKKETVQGPSQKEIDEKRAFNQAYRDFLLSAEGYYGFDIIDANADGIPEILLDFDGAANGGPADMYTYREWDKNVSYAGKGAGALPNMEYCDKTGYIMGKIPGEFQGKFIYDVLIYDYRTGWMNPGPRLMEDKEGRHYEYKDGEIFLVSDEKEQEIRNELKTFFPYSLKPKATYQLSDALLDKFFPIDDEGIKQQLSKG